MRFLVMSLLLIVIQNEYAAKPVDKLNIHEKYALIPYRDIKPVVKIKPLEKRLHSHADLIIILAVVGYGLHQMMLNYAYTYPPYSWFDR
jgi:hypothetical protein